MTDGTPLYPPGRAPNEIAEMERDVLGRVSFAAKLANTLESCPGTHAQRRRWSRAAQALDEAHLALTGKVAGEE